MFCQRLVGLSLIVVLSGCAAGDPEEPVTPQSQAEFAQLTAEWSDRYIECARRHGADARLGPDGSINQPYAPGRETRMGLDAGCLDEVGDPPAAPPASEQLLRGWYLMLVEQAECLRQIDIHISEPPSMQEYVENYSGESWYPLNEVSDEDLSTAMARCPQPDPVEAERRGA